VKLKLQFPLFTSCLENLRAVERGRRRVERGRRSRVERGRGGLEWKEDS